MEKAKSTRRASRIPVLQVMGEEEPGKLSAKSRREVEERESEKKKKKAEESSEEGSNSEEDFTLGDEERVGVTERIKNNGKGESSRLKNLEERMNALGQMMEKIAAHLFEKESSGSSTRSEKGVEDEGEEEEEESVQKVQIQHTPAKRGSKSGQNAKRQSIGWSVHQLKENEGAGGSLQKVVNEPKFPALTSLNIVHVRNFVRKLDEYKNRCKKLGIPTLSLEEGLSLEEKDLILVNMALDPHMRNLYGNEIDEQCLDDAMIAEYFDKLERQTGHTYVSVARMTDDLMDIVKKNIQLSSKAPTPWELAKEIGKGWHTLLGGSIGVWIYL